MKTLWTILAVGSIVLPLLSARAQQSPQPQTEVQNLPYVVYEDYHDLSMPLRELVLLPTPLIGQPSGAPVAVPLGRQPVSASVTARRDPVLQSSALAPSVPITNLVTFDGILYTGFLPPDSNLAVGATQIVQTVNTSFAVFTKTGTPVLQNQIVSLWSNFGGSCQNGPDFADPIVLYDKAAGRWLITELAYDRNNFAQSVECIAVSTSSDATGSYNRYAFSIVGLGDYPKFGVWPDAYYASYNLFTFGGGYFDPYLCAYNRSAMLAGGTASAVCFGAGTTSDFTWLPSDLDGSTAPPAGEPNFYLELSRHSPGSSSSIKLTKFHVDFINPSNSNLTEPISISVAQYTEPCTTCVPQLGTSQQLDSLGDRLMNRLAYRNFGDHESLVVTHSVAAGSSTGMRWYEIRSPNGTPTVYQQGTYAPDANYRWMGSIAMDKFGNMALGYSVSSSGMYPGIRFTGRPPQRGLGTMEAENTISLIGGGSQLPTTCGGQPCGNRWGDYTSMVIDPVDDTTFVYTGEYYSTSSTANWRTRIASFKLGPFLIASFSPTSISYGTRYQSDPPVDRTATLTNNGPGTLNITSIGQGLSGAFSRLGTTCGSTLAQGASCTVTVRFTPADASIGLNTGTLAAVDNADNSPQNVALSGTMRCPPGGCL
jgi:hypothetical protein